MKQSKEQIIKDFDPNSVGVNNGNFIGLPFDYDTSDIIIYPTPWDVTVSYTDGTCHGPQRILDGSYQLDLYLEDAPDAWKKGIYFMPIPKSVLGLSQELRTVSSTYIQALELGNIPDEAALTHINQACAAFHERVEKETTELLIDGKKVVLVGGDHSCPLGYIKALSNQFDSFGILQIDAHCDLRTAYEGFTYSHASIFHNVIQTIPEVSQLTQIGIRDYCEEEAEMASKQSKITLFSNTAIRKNIFEGDTWQKQVKKILDTLPDHIYISFDIDGLDPSLCPHTGTPVPGGFGFDEISYLLQQIRQSGKQLIGADLCEVGNAEWDGNVGARILYQLISIL